MTPADEAALREIAAKIRTCPTDTEVMDAVVKAHALGRASGWRAGRLGEALTLLDEASSRVKDATEAGIAEGLFDREDAEGDFDFIARIDEFKRLVTDDQRASVEWCRCGHEKILHRTDKDGAYCASSEVECQCPRYERASVSGVSEHPRYKEWLASLKGKDPEGVDVAALAASVSGERDGGVKGMYTPDDLVVLLREYIHAIDIDDDELLQRDVAMLNRVLAALAIVAATKPTDRNAGREHAGLVEAQEMLIRASAAISEAKIGGFERFSVEVAEWILRWKPSRAVEAALKGRNECPTRRRWSIFAEARR